MKIRIHKLKSENTSSNRNLQKQWCTNENNAIQHKQNIRHLESVGRQKWQKDTGYGRRSGVENAIYRYKTIISRTLRSKNTANQNTEVKIQRIKIQK